MNAPAPIHCVECGDRPPQGWTYCRKCHSWNDLYAALRFAGSVGIDERKLQRALGALSPRQPQRVTPAMLRQLVRRVADLEQQVEAMA